MENKLFIAVHLLVWDNRTQNIIPEEMEDILDDVRLDVNDHLKLTGNRFSWRTYVFPMEYGHLKAKKEAFMKCYMENKSFHVLTTGITHVTEK